MATRSDNDGGPAGAAPPDETVCCSGCGRHLVRDRDRIASGGEEIYCPTCYGSMMRGGAPGEGPKMSEG